MDGAALPSRLRLARVVISWFLFQISQDVVLGDTTADAGSGNLVDVDVVVARNAADERRRFAAVNVGRSRRRDFGEACVAGGAMARSPIGRLRCRLR